MEAEAIFGDTMRPYMEWMEEESCILREFNEDVDSEELVWHRDKNDRLVRIMESDGWFFQFEDEFPFELLKGMWLKIDNHRYHRVIKGDNNGSLLIKIYEGG